MSIEKKPDVQKGDCFWLSQHRHKKNNYIEIIGVTSGIISLSCFPVMTIICTTGGDNHSKRKSPLGDKVW